MDKPAIRAINESLTADQLASGVPVKVEVKMNCWNCQEAMYEFPDIPYCEVCTAKIRRGETVRSL